MVVFDDAGELGVLRHPCMTRWLAGELDHRRQTLTANDREHYALICCAHSKTAVLELDP